jgi:16S rRNA C967 or C1407 C5-methylase (RsmB/RsmF family)
MPSASNLLQKLSYTLFTDPAEQQRFIEALLTPQPYSPCILWLQPQPGESPFSVESPLPWQPVFVDRLAIASKPGQHRLHDQGEYYCLDFSSVLAASITLAIPTPPAIILDLCAAPGGKSIFLWRQFQPAQLISNETIGKRVGMLIGNLKRCHIQPVTVLSCDPSQLAEALPQTIDLVFVDAPCTGQSLLAKGMKVQGCFHPVTIRQNAQRQKRILANAAQLVAPGGYLAYSTCAFSPEENEQVGQWLMRKFPRFLPIKVEPLTEFQSPLTDLPCYRMWPQSGLGAGAFAMLFQNTQNNLTMPLPEHLPGLRWQFPEQ